MPTTNTHPATLPANLPAAGGPVRPVPPAARNVNDRPAEPAAEPARPGVAFTIHCLLDDFPIDVSFSGSAELLKNTVARLKELGAVPPTVAARQAVEAERQREAPICEFHGAVKESTKRPGSWYCPAKMGDGSYCKSKG